MEDEPRRESASALAGRIATTLAEEIQTDPTTAEAFTLFKKELEASHKFSSASVLFQNAVHSNRPDEEQRRLEAQRDAMYLLLRQQRTKREAQARDNIPLGVAYDSITEVITQVARAYKAESGNMSLDDFYQYEISIIEEIESKLQSQ